MFYVYLLQNSTHRFYTGYTSNLKNRLKEHNRGLNPSTKHQGLWKLVYYEACVNKDDALRREEYLKTTQGKRLLKLRLKNYLIENGRRI
jgi:putative endonuclease